MLMVLIAVLTWFYPVPMQAGASWMISNLPVIVLALLPIDLYIWFKIYRRYRATHPFTAVTLTPVPRENDR